LRIQVSQGTIRYDSVYLTCSKKLTGSQLNLPCTWNKQKIKMQKERCVLCTQRMLKYLKLHTQSTNRKRFSPVVVDNIIKNFVFCPKILLHAAISRNPTTHKFLLHTSCRKTRYFFGAEYTEGA